LICGARGAGTLVIPGRKRLYFVEAIPAVLLAFAVTVSDGETGSRGLTAASYVIGTIGMLVWSWFSERKWHFIIARLLGAASLIAAGALGSAYRALVAVAVATIGIYDSKPSFWLMPSEFLPGTAAAGGIALVNCIGNPGGFAGRMR
jgi:ACS family tartrate transporter-like MFS transporter